MNTPSPAADAAKSSLPHGDAESDRQHLMAFADRCMSIRLDDAHDPSMLSRHAIALTSAIHAAMRGVSRQHSLATGPEQDDFVAGMLTLVEFALGASVALQFEALEGAP